MPILDAIFSIVDKLIPDTESRDKAKLELEAMKVSGELQLLLQQAKVNEVEASHPSIFVAGWRPWIGWVCGSALTWAYVLQPVLIFFIQLFGHEIPKLPEMNTAELITLLSALLGTAALRTGEKIKGVHRDSL